ncbi:MAG: hypothetical protein QGH83_01315 [Candidatus Pacebacteria bacterium]|nr:hypothetical protein [Candidatus Paceibacterota bacterium]
MPAHTTALGKNLITVGKKVLKAVDLVSIMRILTLLTIPFELWAAYKTGVIDKDGKTLKKRRDRETPDEKNSFTIFHKFVRNIKRVIRFIPFGKTILGSLAASLFLIREYQEHPFDSDENTLLERFNEFWEENEEFITELYEVYQDDFDNLLTEEAQTTTAQVAISKYPLTFEPKDRFMGMKVFDVDTDRYMKSRLGKKKYTRYSRYVGEDEVGESIRAYGRKYPKEGIILRDVSTNHMIFLRRPLLDKI